MTLEVEELEFEGLWKIGKVYVLHRPGAFVTYPWIVLTPTGALSKKTKEEAFGTAVAEALEL